MWKWLAVVVCASVISSAGYCAVPNNVICVNCNGGSDSNDGHDWSNAMATVYWALDAARNDSTRKELWVAQGEYETAAAVSFTVQSMSPMAAELTTLVIPPGVKVYGGFAGGEEDRDMRDWRSNVTTLIGAKWEAPVVQSTEDAAGESVIDGFTIHDGDPLLDVSDNLTISHNTFTYIPGVYEIAVNGGSPTIEGNHLESGQYGIMCSASTAHIYNNLIESADLAAITSIWGDASIISNNTIVNGGYAGEGVVVSDADSHPTISNNIIAFNPLSGINVAAGAAPIIGHNCVYGNGSNGDANYVGIDSGLGDVPYDPCFVDRSNNDYHLSSTSPCIDAGDDSAAADPLGLDYYGSPRSVYVHGPANVDMGAAEHQDTTPPTTPIVIVDGRYISNPNQLHATWTSSDPESGVAEYQYAIGTAAGGTDVLDWTTPSPATATSVTQTGLSLQRGTSYFVSVKARNSVGLWSEVGSSGTLYPRVMAVAAGLSHSLALANDGSVWAWGDNRAGQLGDGTTAGHCIPAHVSGLTGVTCIAAGGNHSIALKADGTIWAWGNNADGQLGDGSTTSRPLPAQISGLTGVTAIAAQYGHSLALRADGTVWAWGDNYYGQLGDGSYSRRLNPVQVSGLSGVAAIATGTRHSLALRSDGTIWTWGNNDFGQLGTGNTYCYSTPTKVDGLEAVASIVARGLFSLALKSDGTVRAWGFNDNGQLGDGTTTERLAPVQVSGLSGVVSISAGQYCSYAIRNDGALLEWGKNYYGQLGDGTTSSHLLPFALTTPASIATIVGGNSHTIACASDGSIWAWGNNGNGQLGDGTTTDRHTPVQVIGL